MLLTSRRCPDTRVPCSGKECGATSDTQLAGGRARCNSEPRGGSFWKGPSLPSGQDKPTGRHATQHGQGQAGGGGGSGGLCLAMTLRGLLSSPFSPTALGTVTFSSVGSWALRPGNPVGKAQPDFQEGRPGAGGPQASGAHRGTVGALGAGLWQGFQTQGTG